jgi:prolyl 4-hydroxylase
MSFEYKIIDNFITTEESDSIINFFSDKLSPSMVIGDSYLRNSDDCYIDLDSISDGKLTKVLQNLKNKISEFSELPIENQELLTIIRYKKGQHFKPHLDAFHDYNEFEIEELLGGQRLKTYIICLQPSLSGGETKFDKLNKTIKLEKNQCIYWSNVDENGNIYPESLHSGIDPEEGEKWILTCWIREKKYFAIDRHIVKTIIENYSKEFLINTLKQL